jgi:hypothetical protein
VKTFWGNAFAFADSRLQPVLPPPIHPLRGRCKGVAAPDAVIAADAVTRSPRQLLARMEVKTFPIGATVASRSGGRDGCDQWGA